MTTQQEVPGPLLTTTLALVDHWALATFDRFGFRIHKSIKTRLFDPGQVWNDNGFAAMLVADVSVGKVCGTNVFCSMPAVESKSMPV